MKKVRIDTYLEENYNIGTLEEVRRFIMAGKVLNNNQPVYKPSEMIIPEKADIRFKNLKSFVSRGGLKLKHAIEEFGIDLRDRVMIDIGSSTGGFTDCALQNGASLVYAVDVGTNQLDYKLRIHPQVIVMEQTNFKVTEADDFSPVPDIMSIDVSFTSIVPILRHIRKLFGHEYEIIALIKPQFESFLEERESDGIITSVETHKNVITRVAAECRELDLQPVAVTKSKVKGAKGNQEYLLHIVHNMNGRKSLTEEDIHFVI
ncbi:TlyA family RNA methyltransferase [Salinicoccus halitifaciens]|uniref:23S rRNA (Cytidine1920-2'-O)/16S rRNA (Cytidine1409-2'-O)-methyltransferase n=1 Tax=Salinicoccus halitifaciens TaxID=1073415 RepID=A0ABV2E7J5_9STAP|nr:TlyA family RNA methyltransferase [Salinicoccus halitifaciens]MCD2136917.1 TlyA family RNA methyltransferase [Salinicoccus halitifaciens]